MTGNIGLQMLAISEVTEIPFESYIFCMIYCIDFLKDEQVLRHTQGRAGESQYERALYDFHMS